MLLCWWQPNPALFTLWYLNHECCNHKHWLRYQGLVQSWSIFLAAEMTFQLEFVHLGCGGADQNELKKKLQWSCGQKLKQIQPDCQLWWLVTQVCNQTACCCLNRQLQTGLMNVAYKKPSYYRYVLCFIFGGYGGIVKPNNDSLPSVSSTLPQNPVLELVWLKLLNCQHDSFFSYPPHTIFYMYQ